ncbi:MAG: xanthine dehydrogenase small subunit [bacterium]
MRDSLIFYVNGMRQEVRGESVFRTLSDFLRKELGLTGTKVVCAEGDCGSCTVLLGRFQQGRWNYDGVDCCIQYLFQIDGMHVITVEALSEGGVLHPIQQAMVQHFGSQCGYCTPGFVMALTALLEQQIPFNREHVELGLTGNLCRCTGYQQIFEAAFSLDQKSLPKVSERYRNKEMEKELEEVILSPTMILGSSLSQPGDEKSVYLPATVSEAALYLAEHPEARIVSGGTDVSVQVNKGKSDFKKIISFSHLKELDFLENNDATLSFGAGVNWTELERYCKSNLPEFHKILKVFGSPQIRNAGTIGGNIANASPIADSLPFLLVTDAVLELANSTGTRHVEIKDFFKGYKKMDLMPGEMIRSISLNLPEKNDIFRLYKVSKRKDLDISSFTAGMLLSLNQNRMTKVRLAMGGVAPVALRLKKTEDWLNGKDFSLDIMKQAGRKAVQEISPISDVRASKDYRLRLAENIFEKLYYESNPQPTAYSA